jgi:DNA primase
MSYYQHDPQPALALSLGGELSPEQAGLLRDIFAKYPAAEVVTATDNDDQGDRYAALIEATRPDATRARPPTGKDWNDVINAAPSPTARLLL